MTPDGNGNQPARPTSSVKSGFREYVSSIIIAVGLALLIRSTVVQAFYIPSGSMEDTLLIGDYLLANKFIYGAPIEFPFVSEPLFKLPAIQDPAPGDIVIFRSKTDPGRDLIKRCVAVGGQEVLVVDKILYVDGKVFPNPPLSKYVDNRTHTAAVSPRDNFGPYFVPKNQFFMMGDNRDNSSDSRMFGSVSRRLIKGKAMIIYWSASLKHGPAVFRSLPQILSDAGSFIWNFPTLPFRTRYSRLGDVIH